MRRPNPTMLTPLLFMLALLWMNDAAAWGNLGHRITGVIAESLLTSAASRQVHALLGDESLAVAATDMDTQRALLSERWPHADRWHYDNQPVCNHRPAPCPEGDCATAKIETFRRVLANRRLGKEARANALRWLVHLLGDIHQPLHMADNNDRGGNKIEVRLGGSAETYSLHELLDTVLITQRVGEQRSRDYALTLQQRYQAQLVAWQRGTVAQWAEQSHELAVLRTYSELPGFACGRANAQTITLSASYVRSANEYIPEQLVKAGVRIAAVLNATLK